MGSVLGEGTRGLILANSQIIVTQADRLGRPSALNSDDEKDTITAKIGDFRGRARVLQHY